MHGKRQKASSVRDWLRRARPGVGKESTIPWTIRGQFRIETGAHQRPCPRYDPVLPAPMRCIPKFHGNLQVSIETLRFPRKPSAFRGNLKLSVETFQVSTETFRFPRIPGRGALCETLETWKPE